MNIETAAARYRKDGVKGLEPLLEDAPASEPWLDEIVTAASAPDATASTVGTWLLRAYLVAGADLTKEQTAALLRGLDRVTTNDAKLHLCQAVRELEIPARNAEQLARFLRQCAAGNHKFTRAWAVDALQALGAQHTKYAREAAIALGRAEQDPAASVRARARRIRAER